MTIKKSTCGLCYAGCGIVIHLENGRPIRIEGDPDSPVNKGLLCEKGMASLDYLYHPERLRYPFERRGNRGEGTWERISWDEALGMVSEKLNLVKRELGAESVAFIHGAAKGLQETYLKRERRANTAGENQM